MTLKLVLDRFEGDFGVCLGDGDEKLLISKDVLQNVKESDIFTIEYDGERYFSPTVLTEETERKKTDISRRMRKLFKSYHGRPPKI